MTIRCLENKLYMMNIRIIALFFLCLFLSSCGGGKGTTKTNILVLGAIGNADGGLIVYGQNSNTDQYFAYRQTNASEDKVLELENGSWSFRAIAWEGPNAFGGAPKCAKVSNKELNGGEVTIDFELTDDQCHPGGLQSYDLRFATCSSLDIFTPSSSIASNCHLRGQAKSYRILLPTQNIEVGGGVDFSQGMSSACINDGTPGNADPIHQTNINIPAALLDGREVLLPITIEAFSLANCAGEKEVYAFSESSSGDRREANNSRGTIYHYRDEGGVTGTFAILVSKGICPNGYVPVTGNSTLGTTDFCVMQYEAKNVAGAVSQASTAPWVSINAYNAQNECESLSDLNFPGTFTLISNPEWMTIARDIERTASNWSGGVVGSGHIPRGHSDEQQSTGNALTVDSTNDSYTGTGNNSGQAPGSGWEQKRIHTLSNGSVIWDFAGNVWEWVDWDTSSTGFSNGPTDGPNSWLDFPNLFGSMTANDLLPAIASNDHTRSFGRWYGDGGAALRGGGWFSLNPSGLGVAGVFALHIGFNGWVTNPHFGFRCVYRPAAVPIIEPPA